jgi:hypothetical protein
MLLEVAPQESASILARNLGFLPETLREEISYSLLEIAPQESATGIAKNLKYLPETIQEGTSKKIRNILEIVEKEELIEAERINPALYKEVKAGEHFLRKKFPKTGTETFLLGKTLINNAILRIIPNHAFVSWLEVYGSVEMWKEAGFNYSPIEPILEAHPCKDGKNTRVYAGVLGISVSRYLGMYSNRKYHESVKKQVQAIKDTLVKMGIHHGHTHNDNFCVLHERTPENGIDWSKPPRVYCIDFDKSRKLPLTKK